MLPEILSKCSAKFLSKNWEIYDRKRANVGLGKILGLVLFLAVFFFENLTKNRKA